MRKNTLLCFLFLTCFVCIIHAQFPVTSILPASVSGVDKSSDVYWYQYCNDTIRGGVGSLESGVPIRTSLLIPQERCQQLKGLSIDRISIGLGALLGESYRVFVTRDPLSDEFVYVQEFTPTQADTMSWVTTALSEPVTIDGTSSLYVGCECHIPSNPSGIAFLGVDMYPSDARDNINTVSVWESASQQWIAVPDYNYNLSIKVGITGDALPEHDLSAFSAHFPDYVLVDEEFSGVLTVKNQGMDTLRSVVVDYEFSGNQRQVRLDNLCVAPLHLFEVNLDGLQTSSVGEQSLNVTVSEPDVNDFTPADNQNSWSVFVSEQGLPRTVLLDEFYYNTDEDMSTLNAVIRDSLEKRGWTDRVVWVEHHRSDEFSLKGDKAHFFFDEYMFTPAFMVDNTNFSEQGATIPGYESGELPSPTPPFAYEDGNLFRFIEKRFETPTFISCHYVKTSEAVEGDKTVYGFKLRVEQLANATIPQLRYAMLLTQDGCMDSGAGYIWNHVPVTYYGSYADSWGEDLTLTENVFESSEIFVKIPTGKEADYNLVAYIYDLSADKNSMQIENATSYPMRNAVSSVQSAESVPLVYVSGNHLIVSSEVTQVEIYNLLGQQVASCASDRLSETTLSRGVYLVTLHTVSGTCFQQKVLVP